VQGEILVAWIIISLWHLLTLAVFVGPIGGLLHRWDKKDRERDYRALEDGLPKPKLAPGTSTRRWIVGLAIVIVCGYVGSAMYQVSDDMYRALARL